MKNILSSRGLLAYIVAVCVAVLVKTRYRVLFSGVQNIPQKGGVLLLGNHTSFLDWAMLQLACPRPIRFVMAREYYTKWYFKKVLDMFGVIPISAAGSHEALKTIQEMLQRGEVVGLFPEGRITRNGQLCEFQRGFEIAAKNTDCTLIPFYMRGLWGSRFSHATKKYRATSVVKGRRNVAVAFGEPMANTASTMEVKDEVVKLSAAVWHSFAQDLPPVHIQWLHSAKHYKKSISVVNFDGQELTNAKLLTAAIAFSKRIAVLCRSEQNVALLLPTSSGGIITNLAVLMRGKTVVNLNYTANSASLDHALKMAKIKTVITSQQFLKKLEDRGFDTGVLKGVKVHMLEDVRAGISKLTLLKMLLMVKLLPTALVETLFFKNVDADQTAAILFSSGSEGVPKGVELSHRNILANIEQIWSVLNPVEDDVVMNSLPVFHAFGLTVTMFMPLVKGLKSVCQPDPTDTLAVGKQVAKYKCTLLFGTSTFLGMYARSPKLHPLMFSSLRMVVAGAERLNEHVRVAFKEKFGHTIYEGYGATETTPVISVNLPDILPIDDWTVQMGNSIGTVGRAVPGTLLKIVDPDSLRELPVGEAGLILIGGPQVMKGYLNDAKKTAETVIEMDGLRWYKTGDKGRLNEEGFLTILDRYSRFAKIGGEMVSLSAIETEILNIICQSDLDVVAVALPDVNKGETITLLVGNSELSNAEFKKALIDGGLNPLMLPKQIINVTEIPKLGSGKTDFAAAKRIALEANAVKIEPVTV
ncbi:MAG TPA: AMP-binding protein [Patescibacteria group bacterium]|nr:AMP-binding protein [Patescibacteria group bacterium]